MSESDEPTVRISWRDIYVEVQRQGKMLESLVSHLKVLEDHEMRLRRVEVKVGWGTGIAIAFAALTGAVVAIVIAILT